MAAADEPGAAGALLHAGGDGKRAAVVLEYQPRDRARLRRGLKLAVLLLLACSAFWWGPIAMDWIELRYHRYMAERAWDRMVNHSASADERAFESDGTEATIHHPVPRWWLDYEHHVAGAQGMPVGRSRLAGELDGALLYLGPLMVNGQAEAIVMVRTLDHRIELLAIGPPPWRRGQLSDLRLQSLLNSAWNQPIPIGLGHEPKKRLTFAPGEMTDGADGKRIRIAYTIEDSRGFLDLPLDLVQWRDERQMRVDHGWLSIGMPGAWGFDWHLRDDLDLRTVRAGWTPWPADLRAEAIAVDEEDRVHIMRDGRWEVVEEMDSAPRLVAMLAARGIQDGYAPLQFGRRADWVSVRRRGGNGLISWLRRDGRQIGYWPVGDNLSEIPPEQRVGDRWLAMPGPRGGAVVWDRWRWLLLWIDNEGSEVASYQLDAEQMAELLGWPSLPQGMVVGEAGQVAVGVYRAREEALSAVMFDGPGTAPRVLTWRGNDVPGEGMPEGVGGRCFLSLGGRAWVSALSPDGSRMVLGLSPGVAVVDTRDGRVLLDGAGIWFGGRAWIWTDCGQRLVTAGGPFVYVMDVPQQRISRLELPSDWMTHRFAICPRGARVYVVASGGRVAEAALPAAGD